jgi:hypothetical protein
MRRADPGAPGDFSPLQAFGIELDHFGGIGACRALPASVVSVLLRLGYALALPLQQQTVGIDGRTA